MANMDGVSAMRLSNRVATFLKFYDDTQSAYRFCSDELAKLEKEQNDLLHAIEFNPNGYKERNKLASKLEAVRKDRRFYKDRVGEIEALITFSKDPANAKAINMLKQALGQMRKEESYHEKREYWPRSTDPELKRLFWQVRESNKNTIS